jgi:hypothetical protein
LQPLWGTKNSTNHAPSGTFGFPDEAYICQQSAQTIF